MSVSKFDLSVVALAFGTQSAAEEAFDALTAEMIVWYAAGEYPANADVAAAIKSGLPHLKAATLKVYSSALLKWAKSGQTPKGIRAMVNTLPAGHTKGKAGRPTGKGKGKTPEAAVTAALAAVGEAPDVEAPVTLPITTEWVRYLEGIKAQAAGQKSWKSEDIVALQDCITMALALIKRNKV
jgi:hypothetical protein